MNEATPTSPRWRRLLLLPALLGVVFSIFLLVHEHVASGGIDGFPLDDPWIHLTYARNLAEHGAFSYFPGDPSSAGSTSPLYTLLLALGFLLTNQEKLLSYLLGVVFHAGFLVFLTFWARASLGLWLGALATLLVAFDPRIGILSVSGMETSLFLCLIAAAFWTRSVGRLRWQGICLGLLPWVRPDGLILAGVFVLAEVIAGPKRVPATTAPAIGAMKQQRPTPRPESSLREWLELLLPFAALVVLSLAFNWAIGHRFLPSTLEAKRAYYANTPAWLFLRRDVWTTFATAGWLLLVPFGVIGLGHEALRLLRRGEKPGALPSIRAEVGWVIALPLAYMMMLPFSHRFERYLIPALPAYAIVALRGLLEITQALGARGRFALRTPGAIGAAVLLAGVLTLHAIGVRNADRSYRQIVQYHHARHERAGRWLAEHTPPDAVVATHDVGAIAYYSYRRVIDMVGLIQPDAIAHLHQPDYPAFLAEFFGREKVTHLAVLRNWIEVANVEPLFVADPKPEILEVFAWDPDRTHLMPELASQINQRASQELQRGNIGSGIELLQRSLQEDPGSSRTWLLLGAALELNKNLPAAESHYREARTRAPESASVLLRLAACVARQGRRDEARALVLDLTRLDPVFPGLAELRNALQR